MNLRVPPFPAQEVSQANAGNFARNLHATNRDFIADKVESYSFGPRPIEIEPGRGL